MENRCCENCNITNEYGTKTQFKCYNPRCKCHAQPDVIEGWENKVWMWATNAVPLEHRDADKVEDLLDIIREVAQQAREEERARILELIESTGWGDAETHSDWKEDLVRHIQA